MCRGCFPEPATQPASLLPHVHGFPVLRVLPASPTSTVASVSLRLIHSVDILGPFSTGQDGGGSPRCHDASVSVHAVRSDPAGFSDDLASIGRLLWPSRFSTLSASGCVTRLNRFTCVTAWTSFCLRLTHVVAFMSPRLDSRWDGSSLSGAGVSPAESAGFILAHRKSLLDLKPSGRQAFGYPHSQFRQDHRSEPNLRHGVVPRCGLSAAPTFMSQQLQPLLGSVGVGRESHPLKSSAFSWRTVTPVRI